MVQSPVQQITVAEMIANVIMQRTDRGIWSNWQRQR